MIGATIMDEISEINSSFHVKYRTMGKVQVLFFRNSLVALAKNVCVWVCVGKGEWIPLRGNSVNVLFISSICLGMF